MSTSFPYHPPTKFLISGILMFGLGCFFASLALDQTSNTWFRIVMTFFGLLNIGGGHAQLVLYFRKFNSRYLTIGDHFIEFPGKWKMQKTVLFKDIIHIEESNTYGHVYVVFTKNENHIIEQSWMKQKDFDQVVSLFNPYLEKDIFAMQGFNSLVLREAKPEDAPILKHWDEQQHVIDADPNDDWNWDYELSRSPTWRKQLIAEIDNQPIGFLQIIDPQLEESHYWGDVGPNFLAFDIWIGEKHNLNKGYGTEMMQLAINKVFADKSIHSILIDPLTSNTKAHRFYERLGFRFKEERTFGDDSCSVYQLDRNL